MTNIVNLRQARKAKARVEKAQTAEENRARFGRTKAQRVADAAEEQRRAALLDGARRDEDQSG
jgi:3'-phosphoadenosine 5'-phosphosulfate sulfotransferase (PAPS reductase)/FAD synthetase